MNLTLGAEYVVQDHDTKTFVRVTLLEKLDGEWLWVRWPDGHESKIDEYDLDLSPRAGYTERSSASHHVTS